MPILITGGTGWVGRHLLKRLDEPLVVTRNTDSAVRRTGLPAEKIIECDLNRNTISLNQIDHAGSRESGDATVNAVVNLMGDSVADGRWTNEKKKRLRDSRIAGTENLTRSILTWATLPEVVVSASAIGYYGARGDDVIDESHSPGDDFLSELCVDWEQAAQPLIDAGIRVCFLRIGIVVGKGGGALEKMLMPFKFCVGGKIATGQQWMSWVHLHDLINMIQFLIDNENCRGAFNGTAPESVRNKQFTKSLGKALHRPTLLPVPRFALRLALGEFADYVCASQRVVPAALKSTGFQFQFPTIDSAFKEIFTGNG